MFSPQGYPNGKIIYDFNLSLADSEFNSLHDLEPWRQTFCVRFFYLQLLIYILISTGVCIDDLQL